MKFIVCIVLMVALLGGFDLSTPPPAMSAQEVQFALAAGQSVTFGHYTMVFRGAAGTVPLYDLYVGSALVARLPNPFVSSGKIQYSYANVRVVTTGLALDGTAVTGIIGTE